MEAVLNMSNDNQNEWREWRHDMNDQLSVLGAFLGYCESLSLDDDFKEALCNANLSYQELIKLMKQQAQLSG